MGWYARVITAIIIVCNCYCSPVSDWANWLRPFEHSNWIRYASVCIVCCYSRFNGCGIASLCVHGFHNSRAIQEPFLSNETLAWIWMKATWSSSVFRILCTLWPKGSCIITFHGQIAFLLHAKEKNTLNTTHIGKWTCCRPYVKWNEYFIR